MPLSPTRRQMLQQRLDERIDSRALPIDLPRTQPSLVALLRTRLGTYPAGAGNAGT